MVTISSIFGTQSISTSFKIVRSKPRPAWGNLDRNMGNAEKTYFLFRLERMLKFFQGHAVGNVA